jgi:hypothetical protein
LATSLIVWFAGVFCMRKLLSRYRRTHGPHTYADSWQPIRTIVYPCILNRLGGQHKDQVREDTYWSFIILILKCACGNGRWGAEREVTSFSHDAILRLTAHEHAGQVHIHHLIPVFQGVVLGW